MVIYDLRIEIPGFEEICRGRNGFLIGEQDSGPLVENYKVVVSGGLEVVLSGPNVVGPGGDRKVLPRRLEVLRGRIDVVYRIEEVLSQSIPGIFEIDTRLHHRLFGFGDCQRTRQVVLRLMQSDSGI